MLRAEPIGERDVKISRLRRRRLSPCTRGRVRKERARVCGIEGVLAPRTSILLRAISEVNRGTRSVDAL